MLYPARFLWHVSRGTSAGSGGMVDAYLVRHTLAVSTLCAQSSRGCLRDRGLSNVGRRRAEVLPGCAVRAHCRRRVVDLNHTDEGWPYLVMGIPFGRNPWRRGSSDRDEALPINGGRSVWPDDGVLAALSAT